VTQSYKTNFRSNFDQSKKGRPFDYGLVLREEHIPCSLAQFIVLDAATAGQLDKRAGLSALAIPRTLRLARKIGSSK
jgi:hypothetical protein